MNQEEQILSIRNKLDAIDDKILTLITSRAELALEMKKAKRDNPIYSPAREIQILRRIQTNNTSRLPSDSVRTIFTEIIGACRNLERRLRISYLGPEGTYSHEAAQAMLGTSSQFMPFLTLPEVIKAAESGTSDVALLPIENSSEGAVIETHRLLLGTQLRISGEFTLPIQHCLLSTCTELSQIETVHAHPQALGQCREWLQLNLPNAQLINESSNSAAANVATSKKNSAAIASAQAGLYANVPVFVRGISDFADNKTRFIALSNYKPAPTASDKTSIICTVGDKVGALYELLGVFNAHNVSLTRLESQPQPDHIYAFYIDFDGHGDTPGITKALEELTHEAKTCKILGSYPKGLM